MNKCKITVLKTTFQEDLAKEFGSDGIGLCPKHKEGDVFYADYRCPEGLCDEAWKAFSHYVFALAHDSGRNGGLFFTGRWIDKPGVAICTCNDGIRPVIFKIEHTDEKVLK